MTAINLSEGLIRQAMQSSKVRAALRAKADKVAAEANILGDAEGVEMDATVSDGVRPKGRPYSRVSSPNAAQEWGDSRTERKRVLGRVAERHGTR